MDSVSGRVIGCAIEVHRALGPGLLESAYDACLAREMSVCGLQFTRQVRLPVVYKGVQLDCGYRMDFVVEKQLVVELKAGAHRTRPILDGFERFKAWNTFLMLEGSSHYFLNLG